MTGAPRPGPARLYALDDEVLHRPLDARGRRQHRAFEGLSQPPPFGLIASLELGAGTTSTWITAGACVAGVSLRVEARPYDRGAQIACAVTLAHALV